MSHASRSAHIADLIDDLADLYLAQVADLREFAQATEGRGRHAVSRTSSSSAGDSPGRPLPAVRAGRLRPAPDSGGRPQRARSARGKLMRPSGRRASANLHVPVEQTALLYKEGSETVRRARRDADFLKHLQLGFGETGNLPAQGPKEVSR